MRGVVPFQRWHLAWLLDAGGAADGCSHVLTSEVLVQLEKNGQAWTAQLDGVPVACGGFTALWPGRCQAWVFLNTESGSLMGWLTREVKKKLRAKEGRVEMTVRADFAPGHRWAKLLGFRVETPLLRRYGPEGEDHVGYVRVEEGG